MDTQKRIILWVSTALVIGVTVIGAWQVAKNPKKPLPPRTTPGVLAEPVAVDDWTKGVKDAKVAIVEYSDFQCPACGAYYPIVEKVFAEYKDRISFTYRHFPLPQHQHAETMASASEAAGNQGKFWEMHAVIFEHQADWSSQDKAKARETVMGYAKDLGLDMTRFTTDLDSKETKDRVKHDRDVAVRSSINSTPTFYVNGKKIVPPQGYEGFKKLIDEELAK